MNSGVRSAFTSAMLALCPCASHADVEPGPPPSGAIHEPHGILDAAKRVELSPSLETILKNEKVEVIAAVLKNPDVSEPEALATNMAGKWCESPAHAVVLHVPGREGSPWIVAGGDLIRSIDPDEVRDELAAVRRDASREPDDVSKINTAAGATADMLRYWKGRELARRAVMENECVLIRLELETKARRQQIIMLAMAAAAIPLIVGAVMSARLLGSHSRAPANKS